MGSFVRMALRRHRYSALLCASLTLFFAGLTSTAVPQQYVAEAVVLVVEPAAVHRLATPFSAVPSPSRELSEVPELLLSREKRVALVKRTGLVDQWARGRPQPLLWKDQLLAAVRGPIQEKDTLEALVEMLDHRLFISVDDSRVHISAQWTTPELALTLVENTVVALTQLRTERESRTVEEAAQALDLQLESVRVGMSVRAQRLEAALDGNGSLASLEAERDQLLRDQARAAELMVAAEDRHITAEVFRHSNALRFTLVKPPIRPRAPLGASGPVRTLVGVVCSLLAGLVCAVLLGLSGGKLLSAAQVREALGLEVLGGVSTGQAQALPPSPRQLLLALGLALGTGVAVALGKGNTPLGLLPPLGLLGAFMVWTRPLKWPLLGLILIAVIADDPSGRPYVSLWQSPLFSLGRLFFSNVALFTGFELAVTGLCGVMVYRRLVLPRERAARLDPVASQAPLTLQWALLVSAIFVGLLLVQGLAGGGVFREALWQFRALLMMPAVGLLAMYAFDFPRDLRWLLGVLLAGSLVKSLLGIYFMYAVAFPQGEYPPHSTGHNDTMTLAIAVVTAVALLWERPTRGHLMLLLVWLPVVGMALRFNDRRIAYVDIVFALGLIYLISPWHLMKRSLTRLVVALLPVILLYTAVGWSSNSRVFAPVSKVRSIIAPVEGTEEEGSNAERDIENFNIMRSWYERMVLGRGFGHAFTEYVPSNDFGQSNYGHIGHNSILWLLWIGGIVGFTGVLAYLAVAVYLLGRTLRVTTAWPERVALLVALSVIVTYLMQAFGDMGTQSMLFDFYVGVSVAIVGRLSTRAGVWRAPAPAQELTLLAHPAH